MTSVIVFYSVKRESAPSYYPIYVDWLHNTNGNVMSVFSWYVNLK
jgi:hypothetical protein